MTPGRVLRTPPCSAGRPQVCRVGMIFKVSLVFKLLCEFPGGSLVDGLPPAAHDETPSLADVRLEETTTASDPKKTACEQFKERMRNLKEKRETVVELNPRQKAMQTVLQERVKNRNVFLDQMKAIALQRKDTHLSDEEDAHSGQTIPSESPKRHKHKSAKNKRGKFVNQATSKKQQRVLSNTPSAIRRRHERARIRSGADTKSEYAMSHPQDILDNGELEMHAMGPLQQRQQLQRRPMKMLRFNTGLLRGYQEMKNKANKEELKDLSQLKFKDVSEQDLFQAKVADLRKFMSEIGKSYRYKKSKFELRQKDAPRKKNTRNYICQHIIC